MRGFIVAGALSVTLAGCFSTTSAPPPNYSYTPVTTEALVWVRTDGQSGRANPALADQFANDRAMCGVQPQADNNALRASEPCMRGRGYVLVPASQAESTAARFRAAAGAAGGYRAAG